MFRPFGAHWLAFLGALQHGEGKLLEQAAVQTVHAGGKIFELACNPVNQISADETAEALLGGGISEASYCRFFPGDGSCGDPLGRGNPLDNAMYTIEKDIKFIEGLRRAGLTVKHLTGPSVFVLAKEYGDLEPHHIRDGIRSFVHAIAPMVSGAGLQQNIEYLRYEEDKDVIGSMEEACKLIDLIDLPHVKVHADTFHMLECEEIPHEVLAFAGKRIGYLHAHGDGRVVPGAYKLDGIADATDSVNWHLVGCVLKEIGYEGPVVPEPFGADIRKQIPELGQGLPPAIEAARYYGLAYEHLQHEGILTC